MHPLAVLLHTAIDTIAALQIFHVIELSPPVTEGIFALLSVLKFCGAYFLLYKKDGKEPKTE